jgi:hypothetical protein
MGCTSGKWFVGCTSGKWFVSDRVVAKSLHDGLLAIIFKVFIPFMSPRTFSSPAVFYSFCLWNPGLLLVRSGYKYEHCQQSEIVSIIFKETCPEGILSKDLHSEYRFLKERFPETLHISYKPKIELRFLRKCQWTYLLLAACRLLFHTKYVLRNGNELIYCFCI